MDDVCALFIAQFERCRCVPCQPNVSRGGAYWLFDHAGYGQTHWSLHVVGESAHLASDRGAIINGTLEELCAEFYKVAHTKYKCPNVTRPHE